MLQQFKIQEESSVFLLDLPLSHLSNDRIWGTHFLNCPPARLKQIIKDLISSKVIDSLCIRDRKSISNTMLEEGKASLIRKVVEVESSYLAGDLPQMMVKIENLISFSYQAGYSSFSSTAKKLIETARVNNEGYFQDLLGILKSAAVSILRS